MARQMTKFKFKYCRIHKLAIERRLCSFIFYPNHLRYKLPIIIFVILMSMGCGLEKPKGTEITPVDIKSIRRTPSQTITPSPFLNSEKTGSTATFFPTSEPSIAIKQLQTTTPIPTSVNILVTPSALAKSELTVSLTPEYPKLFGKVSFVGTNEQSERNKIIIADLEKKTWQVVSTDNGGGAFYLDPSWSPDGKKIVYYWITAGSEGYIRIIDLVNHSDNNLMQGSEPAFSPNGQEIAFIRDEKLFLYNFNNRQTMQLSSISGIAYPAWSPSGEKIAFLSTAGEGNINANLMIINYENQEIKQVPLDTMANWSRISWSPDEKTIAFRSFNGCGGICLADVETGKTNCLPKTQDGARDPTWSPDGQWIMYASLSLKDIRYCHPGSEALALDWRLFIVKSDGSDVQPLPTFNTEEFTYIHGPEFSRVVPLLKGNHYLITPLGDKLRLREGYSLDSKVIKFLNRGDKIFVIDGPKDINQQQWWNIETQNGDMGWIVVEDGWLRLGVN